MTQAREAVVVVDFENTFIPESEWWTWELGVPWGGKLSPFINDLVNETRSKWGIIIKTKDYHPRWHMSFASSFRNKRPISEAFAMWMNPNPIENPEYFITYEEVQNWDSNNNWTSEWVDFNYEKLKNYLKNIKGQAQAMWPDHWIAWEQSSKIFSEFDSREDDITIAKWFVPEQECYSGFGWKELLDIDWWKIWERTLEQVLNDSMVKFVKMVWIAWDYCVPASAIDSAIKGFDTTVFTKWSVSVSAAWAVEELRKMREAWVKIID